MDISGCQKIKTCQKNAVVAKITPVLVPILGTVGSSETAVSNDLRSRSNFYNTEG